MTIGNPDETSIGVTAFKSHCLALIDDVAQGKTRRVILLKHNRPVAAIVPIEQEPVELWGAMRGSVRVSPGIDLTVGTGEDWKAASGGPDC
jgi:antitoxin (DNA-binding transcriptional repressor) of toxin-antitoxin stability system